MLWNIQYRTKNCRCQWVLTHCSNMNFLLVFISLQQRRIHLSHETVQLENALIDYNCQIIYSCNTRIKLFSNIRTTFQVHTLAQHIFYKSQHQCTNRKSILNRKFIPTWVSRYNSLKSQKQTTVQWERSFKKRHCACTWQIAFHRL